jgi:hypothetical protein
MMEKGQHIVSLSLGTVAEPSALVVIDPRTEFERPEGEDRIDFENFFAVTWLERFPAGHPIPAVASRVSELMADERLAKNCRLLLDISLTGTAPVRVFKRVGLYPKQIDLTNTGSEEQPTGGVRRAALRDVVAAAQVVLQTGRLKVASKLELASTLVTDLQGFDPKPQARGLDLRGGRNADLVHALAVALWWSDRLTWSPWPSPGRRRENLGPQAWMVG